MSDDKESIRRMEVNKILVKGVTARPTCNISRDEFDNEFQDVSVNVDITSTGGSSTIRKFIPPKLNIHANIYYLLSILNMKDMQELSVLKSVTNMEIKAFRESK